MKPPTTTDATRIEDAILGDVPGGGGDLDRCEFWSGTGTGRAYHRRRRRTVPGLFGRSSRSTAVAMVVLLMWRRSLDGGGVVGPEVAESFPLRLPPPPPSPPWTQSLCPNLRCPFRSRSPVRGADSSIGSCLPGDAAGVRRSGTRMSRSMLASLPAEASGDAWQASEDAFGSSAYDEDGETASMAQQQQRKGGEVSDDTIPVPSLRTIVRFASTTVLIWLSEPLLSLVDTTVVGRYAGSTRPSHLAGLGPATMLCDSSVYLTYFLSIATTNRLTTAAARDDSNEQARVISHALGVAAVLGVVISLFCWVAGPTVLGWIVGAGDVDVSSAAAKAAASGVGDGTMMDPSDVLAASISYVKVRSMVAPAAVVGSVAQSACLSVLDTRTPAVAVAVAATVNVVGDLALCRFAGMGIVGAAIATAAATVCGCAVLLRSTRDRFLSLVSPRWRPLAEGGSGEPGDAAAATTTAAVAETISSADGEGDGRRSGPSASMPFISLPDSSSFVRLVRFAGPIFFVIVGKLVCYSAMTLRANRFGMAELAAHGVMMRIFFFHATFGDSLSQCAQTFLPAVLYRGTTAAEEDGEEDDDCRDRDRDDDGEVGERAGRREDGVNGDFGPSAKPPGFELVGSGGDVESSPVPSGYAEEAERGDVTSSVSPLPPQRSGEAKVTSSPSSRRTTAVRSLLSRLLLLSSVVAVVNCLSATRIVGSHGPWFTADVRISDLMGDAPQRPFMGLALFLHPYIMMLEGSIIAGRDVGYLVMNYAVTIGLVMMMLFCRQCCDSFGGVWRALFLFQVVRLVQFSTRVWRRNIRPSGIGTDSDCE